jgi:phospholipid/cholesterol/gamma-HCH transport system substrate-binding protein
MHAAEGRRLMPRIFRTDRRVPRIARGPLLHGRNAVIAAIVAVAFVAAAATTGAVFAFSGPGPHTYTAYFSEAVGVYPGSDVDVLGVKVGTIDSVRPEGTRVQVVMSVDSGVSVPAGVDAVVIVPSVVADRYIQLSPPYTSGAVLPSGGVIPESRTATPVEIDQIYSAVAKLAGELGPNGVNKNGALNDVLNTGAANLKGNGASLGTMIRELSQLYQTLQHSQGNFFGTIDNLQQFSNVLSKNDSQVRTVQNQLAQVSGFLAADRSSLTAAMSELATALGQVRGFISDNRAGLKANISKLRQLTQLLVNQRASLAEALDNEPLAADNFLNAYDPATGTLNSRGDLQEIDSGRCSYITNPNQAGCPALPLPATGTAQSAGGGR